MPMTTDGTSLDAPLTTRSLPALLSDATLLTLVLAEGTIALAAIIGVLILKASHPLEFAVATALTESGWPLLSTFAIILTAFACALAYRAAACREKTKAIIFIALAVTAGADFAAVRAIEGLRLIREHELMASMVGNTTLTDEVSPDAATAPADPESGAELYAASCAACHGPTGRGKSRVGAPIVGSAFVASTDEAGLVSFLEEGRQPGDPNSVMRMVMPPKGGNLSLTAQDLKDIAAYIKEMAGQEGLTGAIAATPSEPAFEIHKSIAPPAKVGPEGLSAFYRETRSPRTSAPLSQAILSSPNQFPRLFLFVGIVHGLMVAAGLLILAVTAYAFLRGKTGRRIQSILFLSCAHVQMMAVVWIFLVPFLYGPA